MPRRSPSNRFNRGKPRQRSQHAKGVKAIGRRHGQRPVATAALSSPFLRCDGWRVDNDTSYRDGRARAAAMMFSGRAGDATHAEGRAWPMYCRRWAFADGLEVRSSRAARATRYFRAPLYRARRFANGAELRTISFVYRRLRGAGRRYTASRQRSIIGCGDCIARGI